MIFDGLTLTDFHHDLLRNIKSIRVAQDLFDDLSDNPDEWDIAIQTERETGPPGYSDTAIVKRPFERAEYLDAIRFPFMHWAQSRYSDGTFGVWYGADVLETTVHETLYHWRLMLADTGFDRHDRPIVSERRVYRVKCDAALLDFRLRIGQFPALIDPRDYSYTQDVGRRIHREGHPGLISRSARCDGYIYAVFRAEVLSAPRNHCDLSYILEPGNSHVRVERKAGEALY